MTAHRIQTAEGPLTMLVHGMEDSWSTWNGLARHLNCDLDLWALDAPWRAGNDYVWRFGQRPADVLEAELEALPDRPQIIIAHSFGANAVLQYLATGGLPDLRAIVLIAPFCCPPELAVTWGLFQRSRVSFEEQIADGLRARMRTSNRQVTNEIFDRMLEMTMERIGPSGFLTMFESFTSTAHLDLSSIRVPTLVLGGPSDPCLAGRRAASLSQRLADATLSINEGYDHYCHIRSAPAVASDITTFLARQLQVVDPQGRRV